MRNVLRDLFSPYMLPLKKIFEKTKITSDEDKSQYKRSTWEIQQTKISIFQKWEQKIFNHSRLKC